MKLAPNTLMTFNRHDYSDEQLVYLYRALIFPRLIEEKMLALLRQGRISKWFSGIGQEAIAVGATAALAPDEYIFPLHRNLGVFTTRKVPLPKLLAQFQGKEAGFTKGRDRSFHFGSQAHRIVGMISHLGPQMSLANGVALADVLQHQPRVTLAFCGDGATSEGEFHEALNVAAVWQLPVIFLIENNSYGLSTPNYEQFRCERLADKGIGYGIEALRIDGNNLLEVFHTIRHYANELRLAPRPVLIEAMTFRMRGHEEASGTKYVPPHLLEEWATRDPVLHYERYVLQHHIMTEKMVAETKEFYREEIKQAVAEAFALPDPVARTEAEIQDVYFPYVPSPQPPDHRQTHTLRYIDAIAEGLSQSMARMPQLVLMGQDIAEYGGVFKITEGLVQKYGRERVRNTPLCESAIVGAGLGLSIRGMKAMVEMQFADFVTCGFNQIINNLAKLHYRWGEKADVVIRMPTGAGVGAGPFHSQSNEAWFFHTPGLKIVYPSTPFYAKGLLTAALEDPNPVMYFEHKALYRSLSEEVPQQYYSLPIGPARVVAEGEEAVVITYGMGVHWAQALVAENHWQGRIAILDLCTLLPWDKEKVAEMVQKTGKVLVAHEDCLTGGIGGEIAAWIAEHCFQWLDAPVMREGSLDTPVPFSTGLEANFLPRQRMQEKLQRLLDY
ncbi:MAG: dehydrogenase E1 component subunit alpha/beta [Microscillaceae bacterium]